MRRGNTPRGSPPPRARGGTQSVGIDTAEGLVALRNVNGSALGATRNWGIYVDGVISLSNVEVLGSGGTLSVGLYVGEGSATVRSSVLTAQLEGEISQDAPAEGTGAYACVGVYDGSFAPANCP